MAKFTLAQVGKLLDAGYSLDDILAVDNPVETVENPATAPTPTPAPAPAPAPANGDNAILDAINNLTQIIQSGNIRMGGFPAPANANDPQEILASIINPPAKTGKK